MKRSTLALALIALLAVGLATACGSKSAKGARISVSADATIKAKPTLVSLGFSVSTKGSSQARALASNGIAVRRVLAAIKSEGVAPRDIQTEQIGFDQNYSHGQLIGYTASNSVSVSLHDVAKTGELITRVVGAGSTLESGPTFSLENTDLAYRQALDKALDKAHANAAAMARHTGLTLGKPASIKEGVQNIVPVYARFDLEAAKAAPTPVQPGRTDVSASVTVVYSAS